MNQITERYHNRFMLMGGIVKETIELLSSFLGSKRFDMIDIDSGSYPTTARRHATEASPTGDDLSASRYLAHSKTIVFMENVKPYSKTGVNAFEGWDSFVQSGELRELDEPHTWEELNRCLCEGIFVAGDDKTPVGAAGVLEGSCGRARCRACGGSGRATPARCCGSTGTSCRRRTRRRRWRFGTR